MPKPLYFLLLIVVCCSCKDTDKAAKENVPTYPIATVQTEFGSMHFWLFDETPKHKEKFIELAKAKHYDQFTFNRVVRNFVIQGGCPDSPQYFTDSPYLLDPEFVDSIKHVYGALGIGRDNNTQKQSNMCQFYIVNKEAGLPNLDGEYMVIGKILAGEDVLERIEIVKTDNNDKPEMDIQLHVFIQMFSDQELKDSFGL